MYRNRPLVTIVIPTYNRAGTYLRECLESALKQTYSDIEIVVGDNGSTDATPSVVQEYADPRIRYFRRRTNIAPNDNFNLCLQQARGKYVLFLLDDEVIDADFVGAGVEAAGYREDFGLIRTGLRTIDANGTVIAASENRAEGLSFDELAMAWFTGRTAFYLCNTLFNTNQLRGLCGFRSRHNLFQDVMAQVQLAAYWPRVDIRGVKASTRQHRGQYTHTARVRAWCEDSLDLLDLICRLARSDVAELRREGIRFFSMVNYSRAGSIRDPIARIATYKMIYRYFGGQHLPPVKMIMTSTELWRIMRSIKRRALGKPAWAAD